MASSFSRQRNPNMEKALFDWPIVLQYDVKEISRKFFGHEVCLPARSLSQPKPRCVCIRFIHQSNRSISVRLLFLFCSRVFISRSYENRSKDLRQYFQTVLEKKELKSYLYYLFGVEMNLGHAHKRFYLVPCGCPRNFPTSTPVAFKGECPLGVRDLFVVKTSIS